MKANKYCIIRPDLQKNKFGIPVKGGIARGSEKFLYKWNKNNTKFFIWINAGWKEAQSIDFDFIDTKKSISQTKDINALIDQAIKNYKLPKKQKPVKQPTQLKITKGEWEMDWLKPFKRGKGGQIVISAPQWAQFVKIYIHSHYKEEGLANAKAILALPKMMDVLLVLQDHFNNTKPKGLFANMINEALKKAI